MTTVGQILGLSGTDIIGAAADHLSTTGPGLRDRGVALGALDLNQLSQIDIMDLLDQGWHHSRGVQDAARQTVAEPDRTQTVVLPELALTFHFTPSLNVSLNGVRLVSMSLVFDVVVTLVEVTAVLTRGCLTQARAQTMSASVELEAAGTTFSSGSVALARERELLGGRSVPLVEGAQCPP